MTFNISISVKVEWLQSIVGIIRPLLHVPLRAWVSTPRVHASDMIRASFDHYIFTKCLVFMCYVPKSSGAAWACSGGFLDDLGPIGLTACSVRAWRKEIEYAAGFQKGLPKDRWSVRSKLSGLFGHAWVRFSWMI